MRFEEGISALMADFETTWPIPGPLFAFVFLILRQSVVVPHGTTSRTRPSQQSIETKSGGKSNRSGKVGAVRKKAASRIPGGNPMRAFLLWGRNWSAKFISPAWQRWSCRRAVRENGRDRSSGRSGTWEVNDEANGGTFRLSFAFHSHLTRRTARRIGPYLF